MMSIKLGWEDFVLFLISAGLPAVIVFVGATLVLKSGRSGDSPFEPAQILVLILGVSSLGAVAGYSGGLSRVGVVGDVIPAALALAGGVSAYLFGVDRSKGVIASLAAIAFSFALLVSYSNGAQKRGAIDIFSEARDHCYAAMSESLPQGDRVGVCTFLNTMGKFCAKVLHDQDKRIFSTDSNVNWQAEWNDMLDNLERLQHNYCD